MEIKNLKKLADRIKKAIKNKERIILYGDADLDGVASVIILKETIKNLGGQITAIYFPDREIEGYGINEGALNFLKNYAPALFIALDCGIGNFKEIKLAKKLRLEVIIIDHHEILNKLPEASIIVDPKQKGDSYPFKGLATAGIVFKLSQLLLGEEFSQNLKNSFLELTAIATIADLMPEIEENKIYIEEGLKSLEKTFRPGFQVFWQINTIKEVRQLAQKIISACHAGGTKDHLNEGYLLLTSISTKEAEVRAKKLLEKAYLRHLKIKVIVEEIERRLLEKPDSLIIFEGDKSWEILMIGPAASRLCHNYKKPVFLYSQKENESQGAVRTPEGIDGVKVMMHCSKFLETYGGHPQAAGFRIKNDHLDKFKKCLIEYFTK